MQCEQEKTSSNHIQVLVLGPVHSFLQGSAKRQSRVLVTFVAAVAYHFSLALPAVITQPRYHLLVESCISSALNVHVKYEIHGPLYPNCILCVASQLAVHICILQPYVVHSSMYNFTVIVISLS